MANRIDELLRQAAPRIAVASDTPALDAELLLGHVLGVSRAALRAHGEREIDPRQAGLFETLLARRARGEPVAYLTGHRGFWDLELSVGPGVLVPRPETELLVEAALMALRTMVAPRVLDLGTGSGAIALAIASELPTAQVVAIDSSAAALEHARRNAAAAGLERISLLEGHWFEPIGQSRFDAVLANPPYLAEGDIHLAGLAHEPAAALVAGPTGLESLAEIIASAPAHLRRGGVLLLEHGHDQGAAVRSLCAAAGLEDIDTLTDLAGLERVTGARRPAGSGSHG